MDELKFPDFFIKICSSFLGEKTSLMVSIFMFTQTDVGKKLLKEVNDAFESPEGKKLLEQIEKILKIEPNA